MESFIPTLQYPAFIKPLGFSVDTSSYAMLSASVLVGQKPDGNFGFVGVSADGTLKTAGGSGSSGSGNVSVLNFPSTYTVTGSIVVSNFPSTQAVSGNVAVTNFPAGFSVLNFPSTQPVSAVALPLPWFRACHLVFAHEMFRVVDE